MQNKKLKHEKLVSNIRYVNGFPTHETIPESHIRTVGELGLEPEEVEYYLNEDIPTDESLERTFTIASNYDVKNYTFPPTCYYLEDEDREAAGQLLGNWMAYTEDVYDELISLGVEPKDLVYMVKWKRDEE